MAHQLNTTFEEGLVVPKNNKFIKTQREIPALRAKPSELVSRMHEKVKNFCRIYAGEHFQDEDLEDEKLEDEKLKDEKIEDEKLEKFMSPETKEGILYEFLSQDRREREYDRMTQPDGQKYKPVPTEAFDTIIRDVAEWYYFRPQIDDMRFEQFSRFLVRLWNRAYEIPEKELRENRSKRVITSLELLNRSLGIFFRNKYPKVQPKVWNVINWWLLPPDTVNLFKPADSRSREKCWDKLGKLEKKLRSSNHLLDIEKANIVRIWLLEWEKREQTELTRKNAHRAEQESNCLEQLYEVPQQLQQILDLLERGERASNRLQRLPYMQQHLKQQLQQLRQLIQ
ncbi:hypothetical protein E8E14_008376 [Neopestalotiopsis sp. 37M]|nr:hypothetical protein E8E14_008376 [Neopestalotiopsis sp. 37M]